MPLLPPTHSQAGLSQSGKGRVDLNAPARFRANSQYSIQVNYDGGSDLDAEENPLGERGTMTKNVWRPV